MNMIVEGIKMLESCPCDDKRKKMKKKEARRFSDEQIRCLEMVFESERKLEARKKVEVARELGLQPRQVAIWFQNKRARWKSKHIEKEYSLLLSNYNNLSAQIDSLTKHNHALQIQLEKLKKEMMMMSRGKENEEWAVEEGGATNGIVNSDDDIHIHSNIKVEQVLQERRQQQEEEEEEEEKDLLRMLDTSDWGSSLDSDDIIINQSSCQWWGFWS